MSSRAPLASFVPVLLAGSFLTFVPLRSIFADSASSQGRDAAGAPVRGPAGAATATPKTAKADPVVEEIPSIDVLEGLRTRQLTATAEGASDGRVTLSLTNRTGRKLRVVLPPGLVVANATGQFGGMGGFGGGMGGMGGMMGGGMGGGMMGGGMGGGMMGGGMGGGMMGGGMGGGMMGGGMGGRGGMMGGMSGGTMPASMGMMMLGRLIMSLVGEKDSWDQRSLMMGMMMGMGGGMGMMGGGMGGMGMMGGGMGGGMRSVPPTGLPETTLKPHQTRNLPTSAVSLGGPDSEGRPAFPVKGEKYRVGSVDQATGDVRVRAAMKQLAEDKAPQSVAQLVLWNLASGLSWEEVAQRSKDWANDQERALARQFVARLDAGSSSKTDSGTLYFEVKGEGRESADLAAAVRTLWGKVPVLGLKAADGIPAEPNGPALACRLEISETSVNVTLTTSDAQGVAWTSLGSFRVKRSEIVSEKDASAPDKAARLADAVAEGALGRLVHVRLSKGPRVKDRPTYKLTIENGSPLVLNGVALAGVVTTEKTTPSLLNGFCLPPHRDWSVPATLEMVSRLKLKDGVRVLAADLSGL